MDARLTAQPPDTPAWRALADLLIRRGELAAHVDEIERRRGEAASAAHGAADALAEPRAAQSRRRGRAGLTAQASCELDEIIEDAWRPRQQAR